VVIECGDRARLLLLGSRPSEHPGTPPGSPGAARRLRAMATGGQRHRYGRWGTFDRSDATGAAAQRLQFLPLQELKS